MKRFSLISLFCVLLIFATGYVSAAEDIIVVVNKDNKDALTLETVKDIFLIKQTTWSDKAKVVVALPEADSKEAKALEEKIFDGMTNKEFNAFWMKVVFSDAKLTSIPQHLNSAATADFIKNYPNGIAVISGAAFNPATMKKVVSL